VLLPLLALTTVLADTAWLIFSRANLERAVRVGVRMGVTQTAIDLNGGCLTEAVKAKVQENALGMLKGSAGLAKIKVNYLLPPLPNSTGPTVDVSHLATGNRGGNIMKVSVQNYSLPALMPRIFKGSVDKNPTVITVAAADVIEPTRMPPCIGSAP
jgi:hypothetical protein